MPQGKRTNLPVDTAKAGDWGGIVFRNDLDAGLSGDLDKQGVFLNYVSEADISYGGGSVVVDSQSQVFSPLHLIQTDPLE